MGLYRLLVVDPQPAFGEWLGKSLTEAGFDVRVASEGASALALGAMFKPHAVVVDAFLPGMGGRGFMMALREQDPHRRIGALFCIDFDVLGAIARESYPGLDDFVTKPPNLPEVVERLHMMLMRIERLSELVLDLGRHVGRMSATSETR